MLWLLFVLSVFGFAGPPISVGVVPSTAMSEALLVDDIYLADLYAYARNDPHRGDVAMFHPYAGDRTFFIDRVVGLPGDRVQMVDGRLVINGKPVAEEPGSDRPIALAPEKARRFIETLPNGVRYETLDFERGGFSDNTVEFAVPA